MTKNHFNNGAWRDLEEEINTLPFQNTQFGVVLASYLIIGGLQGYRLGPIARISQVGKLFRSLARILLAREQPISRRPSPSPSNAKYVFTHLADRPHLSRPVSLIIDALGSDQCTVLSLDRSSRVPWPTELLVVPLFSKTCCYLSWSEKAELIRCLLLWSKCLSRTRKRYELPSEFLLSAINVLLEGVRQFAYIRRTSLLSSTKTLVVEHDRHGMLAPIVLAAKSRKIPTYALQHGLINSAFGFTPLSADRILCWGDVSSAKLSEFGVPSDQLDIVGNPAAPDLPTHSAPPDVEPGCEVESRTDIEVVVTLATNHGPPPFERLRLVEGFLQATNGMDHVTRVIRLHPSERAEFYTATLLLHRNVCVESGLDPQLSRLGRQPHIVVCHNTTLGLDAMATGAPVVVFDYINSPLLGTQHWVESGDVSVARSPEDLARILRAIICDEALWRKVVVKQTRYVRSHFLYQGREASAHIARLILERHEGAMKTRQQY